MDGENDPTTDSICDFDIDLIRTETGASVVGYDHESDPLSIAVPALVAHCEATEPCSLPPLYETIDPDALEALFRDGRSASSKIAVSFQYAGYTVAAGDGLLSVTQAPE
jgi:hypothetical protein